MNVSKRTGEVEQLSKKKIYDSIVNANNAVQSNDEKLT